MMASQTFRLRVDRLAVRDRLTIVRPGVAAPSSSADEETITLEDLRGWIASGRGLSRLGRYREARILVHRLESAGRPLPLAIALRLLCRGPIYLEDAGGRRRPLRVGELARWTGQIAREPLRVAALLRPMQVRIERLDAVDRSSRAGGLPGLAR